MKNLLRRGTLTALVALVVLPAAANAAFTPTVTVSPTASGCGPKGTNALPSTGGGLPAGTYKYKIEATVGGNDTAPCEELVTGSAAANAAFLLVWETTPGATQYKIFRNDQLVKTVAVPTALSATGQCSAAQAAPDTDTVSRCFAVDNAGNAVVAGTPVALPAAATQAGGNPDLGIAQAFDYNGVATDSSDDTTPNGTTANSASLKTNVLHFPAGLAANPGVTAKVCTLAQLIGDKDLHGTADTAEDKCPRSSQVGTITARIETQNATPATTQPTPTIGDIYLGEKLAGGTETARLYVVLRPACSSGQVAPLAPGASACSSLPAGTEVEKSFLSAKATIRKDGTFGIDNETTNISDGTDQPLEPVSHIDITSTGGRAPSNVPIQVQSIKQNLFGKADQGTAATTDDKGFVVLSTSCAAHTFSISASSYLDPVAVNANAAAMQSTGCDSLAFDPKLTLAVDATGQSQQNGHPKVTATITQGATESATQNTVVTLPAGLGTNIAILGSACTQAQVTSESCPAASKIGTATATTPLLPGTFTGDVFLAEPPVAGNLPNLEVFLKGPADIHITGTTAFDSTQTRLVNSFANLPEVPLNSFTLVINGGATGLLNNAQALCKSGLGNADAVFNGYNGKNTTASVPVALTGVDATPCASTPPTYYTSVAKPKFAVKVKGVKRGRPKVTMSIKRGNAVKKSNPRVSKVNLPKGMKFTKKAKKRTVVKVNGKKVKTFTVKGRKITVKSKSTTKTITVSTKSGAIKETSKLRKKGKKQKLSFKGTVKVQKPKTYKISKKVKPKS